MRDYRFVVELKEATLVLASVDGAQVVQGLTKVLRESGYRFRYFGVGKTTYIVEV